LETSVTKSDEYWRGKEIHYKMNPENIPCITAAKIDYCALANNHVLDWGYLGLTETLDTLAKVRVKTSGAGENAKQAGSPAVLEVEGKGRTIVFSVGSETSGIPPRWAASENKPGINLIEDLSNEAFDKFRKKVEEIKVQGDIVIASIHWGANWGYDVPKEQQEFAHRLIDEAKVDLIHGHSSHHVKGIEVYKDKLILYGCGDFLNDYEGIGDYESFRSDLCLMYFANVEVVTGNLLSLEMVPMHIKLFRVNNSSRADAVWVRNMLEREERKFGCAVQFARGNTLSLLWNR
jgi:poly-gamma-glutamate synthesis protein (capsule biosynthesis protein)